MLGEQMLISAIIAFGVFLTFSVVIYRMKGIRERIVLSSILILSSLMIYRHIDDFSGKPAVMSEQVDKAWVLGFHADTANKRLYLWLRLPNSEYPISYQVPYSPKMDSKLNQMRRKHKGKPYLAKIKGGTSVTKPYSNGSEPGLLEIPRLMPKKGLR